MDGAASTGREENFCMRILVIGEFIKSPMANFNK
jgi:hypothetical protein